MSRSLMLAATESEQTLSSFLNELDAESSHNTEEIHFAKGPFSAFRVSKVLPPSPPTLDRGNQPSQEHFQGDNVVSSGTLPVAEQDWDDSLPGLTVEDDFDMQIFRDASDVLQSSLTSIVPLVSQSILNTAIVPEEFAPSSVPSSTGYLLQHWRSNMDSWFSPLRIRKHPWRALHLPIALNTMSELSVWGSSSNAKVTVFRALLSVSAFTLDRSGFGTARDSTFWYELATRNRNLAKSEMKQCFSRELRGPSRAKYKEILVALLSLVSSSVVSGQHAETRSYLLDAERFIALRGIPKLNKSRKVKILHHMFLFLRVIEESTYIYSRRELDSPWRPENRNTEQYLFPSLHTNSWLSNKDLDQISGASFESELISQSRTEPSLMMAIYGIPLSLFSLISKTTSLANELESLKGALSASANNMSARIKQLEDDVCNWNMQDAITAESNIQYDDHILSPSLNGEMLNHVILAIYNSLILYFYRRIHNVNSMILQPYVERVIENLEKMEKHKMESNILNTSIIWPGFMAAVEARGTIRRHAALSWLKQTAKASGWRSFDAASRVAEDLWRVQREENPCATWVDILRGKGTVLVLT